MRSILFALLGMALLAGCATTPPIATTYYPSRSGISVKLVRTVACDKQDMPIIATTPTITIHQSADLASPRQLSFAGIDGPLANSDIKLEFYADRRLKSVNATTTGQGKEIVTAALSLASALAGPRVRNPFAAECKLLKSHFADEPLTLIFVTDDPLDATTRTVPITSDSQSAHYQKMFSTLLGDACFTVGKPQGTEPPVTLPGNGSRYAMLRMRQPAQIQVTVSVGPTGSCTQTSLWSEMVPVGQHGVDYDIPIPRAAAFGKQAFAASWDEAGAITSLQYGKEDGTASALDAAKLYHDALYRTPAERTTTATAEADLIKAQQRLVKCRANPEICE